MSLHKQAHKLASEGKSNAEIWGALEITSGALQRMMQTDPKLLFSILQGRGEYISGLLSILTEVAEGTLDESSRVNARVVHLLLERAETNNRTLTVAHEVVLTSGTAATPTQEARDPATVTSLLRAAK